MKNNYRVAVLIYPEGDEHLVFQDQPETVVIEDAPLATPADITATAAIVARRAEEALHDYEQPLDYDESKDN